MGDLERFFDEVGSFLQSLADSALNAAALVGAVIGGGFVLAVLVKTGMLGTALHIAASG